MGWFWALLLFSNSSSNRIQHVLVETTQERAERLAKEAEQRRRAAIEWRNFINSPITQIMLMTIFLLWTITYLPWVLHILGGN